MTEVSQPVEGGMGQLNRLSVQIENNIQGLTIDY